MINLIPFSDLLGSFPTLNNIPNPNSGSTPKLLVSDYGGMASHLLPGQHTFLDPAKPSDSVRKYAKGIRTNRARFENRNIRFHSPVEPTNQNKLQFKSELPMGDFWDAGGSRHNILFFAALNGTHIISKALWFHFFFFKNLMTKEWGWNLKVNIFIRFHFSRDSCHGQELGSTKGIKTL